MGAELPDTGKRVTYGEDMAVREAADDKPAMEGISPFLDIRLGDLLRKGGVKYGDFRNWEKGMPYTNCTGAIRRHLAKYLLQDEAEDHLAAIVWNAMALMHYEETGAGIDDVPRYPRSEA
jgi:hypothetical protein